MGSHIAANLVSDTGESIGQLAVPVDFSGVPELPEIVSILGCGAAILVGQFPVTYRWYGKLPVAVTMRWNPEKKV